MSLLLSGVATLIGCGGPMYDAQPRKLPTLADPPRRTGRELVLLVMPEGEAFRSARHGLMSELSEEFDVVTLSISSRTAAKDFGARVSQLRPSCLVLMDNSAVNLLRTLQKQGERSLPPAVVLMAVFLPRIVDEVANMTGVVYEVPCVAALVQLRAIVAKPVNRVGVVHRPSFAKVIERERDLAAREQFRLVSEQVPHSPTVDDVHLALERLKERRVDALWVLNDRNLIRGAEYFQTAWLEAAPELGVPIVVNVPTLINPRFQFGTIGVLPDHEALGAQAANLVFDLADEDWSLEHSSIEFPTSTITIVDMSQLNSRFELAKDAERRIDRVLE